MEFKFQIKKTPYIFDKIYEGKTWQKIIYQYDIISIYCNGKSTKKIFAYLNFIFKLTKGGYTLNPKFTALLKDVSTMLHILE